MVKKKKLAFVLGIRPDIIRAALILKYLKSYKDIETVFIWSGQHYSDNLKDIFFRELNAPRPDIELGCSGATDAEIVSSLITKLYETLDKIKPDACMFLGDTNTVGGSLAPAQLNIPIIHIEGCGRSYDWRMPEEKYRSVIDHLSDLIYTYYDEYKQNGVNEGINPRNIKVVGNPIVDILKTYYFAKKKDFEKIADEKFFKKHGIEKGKYYLMTCHRRENVGDPKTFKSIIGLVKHSPYPIYFPASYRTQGVIKELKIKLPKNITLVDPIGYNEFLALMVNSRGVLTDSGTVVEETSVLMVPSLQMRRSTERPQTYDAGSSVKFDPTNPKKYPAKIVFAKLESLFGKKWKHGLGDGKTSERIAKDLHKCLLSDNIKGHLPANYHYPIARSYREDGIKVKLSKKRTSKR